MNYGQVVFAAKIATVDSGDAGPEPDITPVTGYIDFIPSRVVTYADDLGSLLVIGSVTAGLDADGVMRDPDGNASVTLIASDSPELSNQGWTWEGYLRLNGVDEQIGPYPFVLNGGATVNLALQAPLEISNGIAILRGPRGEKGEKGDTGTSAVESVNGRTGVIVLAPEDVGLADAVRIGGDISGTPSNPTVPLRYFPINNLDGSNPSRPATTANAIWLAADGNRPAPNGSTAGGAYAAAEGDLGAFTS